MADEIPSEPNKKKKEEVTEEIDMFNTARLYFTKLTKQTEVRVDVKDDLRQALDEAHTEGPGGAPESSRVDREMPFYLENTGYIMNTFMQSVDELPLEPLSNLEKSGYITLDQWNQAIFTANESILGVLDDKALEPCSAFFRFSGREMFYCGSLYEGTATSFTTHPHYGGTDLDLMVCYPLKGDPIDVKNRPGYMNLYSDDQKGFRKDQNNYIYSKSIQQSLLHLFQSNSNRLKCSSEDWGGNVHEITGPAVGMYGDATMKDKGGDIVLGFYCNSVWPKVAQEWLTRERPTGWPSPCILKKVRSYGTYVVPVAHPLSDNPDIEWRYSFSKPELDLMRSVTDTQRKCYMLTKRNCNLMFEHYKSVSTYHVKTAFFWLLEELPPQGWVQMTMLELVNFLLEKLANYFIFRRLPHYFIKHANIIDHHPNETMRICVQKLEHLRRGAMPKYIKDDFCLNAIWETVPPCDEKVAKVSKYRLIDIPSEDEEDEEKE